MNLQISLAMFVALCLSNASSVVRRSSDKENITLDLVESEILKIRNLFKQQDEKQRQATVQSLHDLVNSLSGNDTATNKSHANSLRNDSVSTTQLNKTTDGLSGSRSTSSTKTTVTTLRSTTEEQAPKPSAKSTTVQQVRSTTQTTKKTTTKSSTTQKATENIAKSTAKQTPSTTQTKTEKTMTKTPPKPTAKPASPTTQTTTEKQPTQSSTKSTKKNKTISSLNDTQSGNAADASVNTNQSPRSSSELFHRRSIFPVFFMVILVVVVAVYFVYHNKSKIHGLIREGYGKAKKTGTSYVKVKLEDDIELPREANRQYVY